MDERLTSGDEGLDMILGGGLPVNGINLIIGLPGSGKTMLSQQFVFAGATEERPAIYFSTVSEPFEKMLRYGQTLSFFDRHAIGRSIYYEDLGGALVGEDGLTAVTERIGVLIRERRPGIIAIDSFKALAAFAQDAQAFRRFLHDLAALLTAFPVTSFWIGEYSERRDARGAGGRRGRRDHRPRDGACERAHTTPDSGDQAARGRVPLRTSRISPLQRRHHCLSPARRPRQTGGVSARRRPNLLRHPAARQYARRGLQAG